MKYGRLKTVKVAFDYEYMKTFSLCTEEKVEGKKRIIGGLNVDCSLVCYGSWYLLKIQKCSSWREMYFYDILEN